MDSLTTVYCLVGLFSASLALECYVCENQGDNRDKCVKTTIQCRENQDTCMTRVHWHAPEFWTPRSVKIHHVYKSCNSSNFCAMEQRRLGLTCMRDWYRDWECVECCQGDRCNYYTTLDASSIKASATLLTVSMVIHFVFRITDTQNILPSFLHVV
ncbi:UPAR/Ly6 domain-containing protein cold-like [Haliotis cracherodii]|uniref:UPAR/Ly6 domain-containing protein cold-like n=1 Tax=Haliotis cracherodii TaxID=6455 RepID=UPI0039E89835